MRAAAIWGAMGVDKSGVKSSVTWPFMVSLSATIMTCWLEAFPEKESVFPGV